MPLPIPPPEPPAIVQPLPPEKATSISKDTGVSTAIEMGAGKPLTTAAPETFLPEPSPPTPSNRSVLLGPPLSVRYPDRRVEITNESNSSEKSAIAPAGQPALSRSNAAANQVVRVQVLMEGEAAPTSHAQRTQIKLQSPASESQPKTPATPAQIQSVPLPPPDSTPQPSSQPSAPATPTQSSPTTPQPSSQPSAPATPTQPSPTTPQPSSQPSAPVTPTQPSPGTPQPSSQPPGQTAPGTPPVTERVIELTADSQEYDDQRQIVTATGNVELRFEGAVLNADRLQVNLLNLIAAGEGNVQLTSGAQLLRGQRFTYSFIQDSGQIFNARGEIYIPTAGSDFSVPLATDVTAGGVPAQSPGDRIVASQPLQQVTSTGGISAGATGLGLPKIGGTVKRLRFEAELIDFYPRGWQANQVRITNDPFSPPELEVRANTATLTRETPLRDRIRTTRQRVVFDQGLSVPIPKDEAVIDRSERRPSPGGIAQIGYDDDRGGLYVQRSFTPLDTPNVRFSLTPQFFAQRSLEDGVFSASSYGLKSNLDVIFGPDTTLQGSATFNSLDPSDFEDEVRASLRLRQKVNIAVPHTLALEYSYRDRLYNGSLGYQRVQSSLGGVLSSPNILLGNTGINLSYQLGAQFIDARTDRRELLDLDPLEPVDREDRVSLGRFQGAAALSRGFTLWAGKPLPATATEGLRYTPAPVVPYVAIYGGIQGVASFYTSGDTQTTLTGTIGLAAQFGHFSRPFFDYTALNIAFSQAIRGGELSPFLFDRAADNQVLVAGITQQIYGPLRVGFQTVISLNRGETYSTDYILEYSRRTYGVSLRYNPELEIGSLNLRITDFNWVGGTDQFSESDEVTPVINGVERVND